MTKRLGGVAGILFVALFVAAAATGPNPDLTQADYAHRLQSLYAGSTNQARISLSFSLGILGVLSFILFLGGLWEALREAGGEDPSSPGTGLANDEPTELSQTAAALGLKTSV